MHALNMQVEFSVLPSLSALCLSEWSMCLIVLEKKKHVNLSSLLQN